MGVYLGSRLWQAALTLLGISTLLFFVLRLSGDPVALLLPTDAPPEARAALRRDLGLDAGLSVQYARFMQRLITLDFGDSLRMRTPALQLVLDRIPATATLALSSMAVAIAWGLPAGILAAVRPRSGVSACVMVLAILGQAMPVFWSGIVLILLFSVELRWLPAFGSGDWQHLVLPTVALAGWPMARIARLARVGMAEILQEDYIRTAHAKGLSEMVVVCKHGVRNSAIAVLTVIGIELGFMLGGAVITETIFSWPGVGRQLMEGVLARDYPLVQAAVFVIAIMVLLINLLVDVAYVCVDPRLRAS